MKKTRLHLLLLLAVLLIAGAAAGSRPPKSWDEEAARRKAGYIYLEAANAMLSDDEPSRYMLLRRAYELDTADRSIGNEYGLYMLSLADDDDSVASAEGLRLMRRYFDTYPDDMFEGARYALVSQSAGNTEEALRAYRVLHRRHPGNSQLTRRYADILTQAGGLDSLDRALALYDTVAASEGPDIEVVAARLQLLYMRRDTAAIIAGARGVLDSAPLSSENNVFYADVLKALEMNDSAGYYYDRAVALDSLYPVAAFSRAEFYKSMGDSAAYDREIFRTLQLEDLPVGSKLEILRGYISGLQNNPAQQPRVLALYEHLVGLHPHEPELRKNYAVYLYVIGHMAEAAEQQEMVLSLDPADVRSWRAQAIYYEAAGDTAAELSTLEKASSLFPDDVELAISRGMMLTLTGDYANAHKAYSHALEVADSDDVELLSNIYVGIGDIFMKEEKVDSGLDSYRRAIDFDPFNSMALNNCAYFMACNNIDLPEARKLIERVLNENTDDPTPIDTYAWILFKQGELEEARREIDRAISLSGDEGPSWEILDHAGDIYFSNGLTDEAFDFWQRALDLNPSSAELRQKLTSKSNSDNE